MIIKGLSLKQPWAEMLISGRKRIETRTWATRYRGPLLICASKNYDAGASLKFGYDCMALEFGKAIGVFNLDDCLPMTEADVEGACFPCEPGRFAWKSYSPASRLKESFYIKGRLGLFTLQPFELTQLERVLQAGDKA